MSERTGPEAVTNAEAEELIVSFTRKAHSELLYFIDCKIEDEKIVANHLMLSFCSVPMDGGQGIVASQIKLGTSDVAPLTRNT